jgi:hypothetical protein
LGPQLLCPLTQGGRTFRRQDPSQHDPSRVHEAPSWLARPVLGECNEGYEPDLELVQQIVLRFIRSQ